MKTKSILLLVVSAVITLSFTVASVTRTEKKAETTTKVNHREPAGGFVMEDKL